MTEGALHKAASVAHSDGTRRFSAPDDSQREQRLADYLARVWHVELIRQAGLDHVDYQLRRDDRTIGWAEVKQSSYAYARLIRTVGGIYLKNSKFELLLRLAGTPLSEVWWGCVMVWRFTDGVYKARISDDLRRRPFRMTDPRGATNDTAELGVLIEPDCVTPISATDRTGRRE